METVKVSVKGAGSLEVESDDTAAEIFGSIMIHLSNIPGYKVRMIKRGPKKRQIVADEGSEGNNHD